MAAILVISTLAYNLSTYDFYAPILANYIFVLNCCNFRVSHFRVSHLTRETVKLCLQNTLNMSKTARVYFGVLQFSPPYKNFVLEIHTLVCAYSVSDPFFSCLLQKLERDSHLSHQSSIKTTSPVLIFQSRICTYSFESIYRTGHPH